LHDLTKDFKEFLISVIKNKDNSWKRFLDDKIQNYKNLGKRDEKEKTKLDNCNKFVSSLFPEEINKWDFTYEELREINKVCGVGIGKIKQIQEEYINNKLFIDEVQRKCKYKLPFPKDLKSFQKELIDNCENTQEVKFLRTQQEMQIYRKSGFSKKEYEEERQKKYYRLSKDFTKTWMYRL